MSKKSDLVPITSFVLDGQYIERAYLTYIHSWEDEIFILNGQYIERAYLTYIHRREGEIFILNKQYIERAN